MNLLKLPDDHITCISQLQKTCPTAVLQVLEMLKNDTAKVYGHDEQSSNLGAGLVFEYRSRDGEVKKVGLKKYVYRCTKNLLIDEKRREKALREHGNRINKFNSNRTPDGPDVGMQKEEVRLFVNLALSTLSTKLRDTARLHWLKGKTVAEIAIELTVPAKTVYDRLSRAESELRAKLTSKLQTERN